jgi:LysR family glycine cleavage system transcriptional activator
MPRVRALMAALPDIDIRVNAQGNYPHENRSPFPALADAPADVQIVYGDKGVWDGRASLLLSEAYQPYCSPAFAQTHGIGSPEDLRPPMLIRTALNFLSWDEWLTLQGIDIDGARAGAIQMDPSHLAIGAACDGVGVILESSALVAQAVAEGALIAPFPDRARPGAGYWMYTPSAFSLGPSVQGVRAWLQAAAGTTP